jgi:quinol monooxygenase YgiN
MGEPTPRRYLEDASSSHFANSIMETSMIKLAFLARFEAKPGKEEAVANFLQAALDMAKKEPTTINWYAIRLSPTTFGVFDTFNDETGRQQHLNGPIGQALMAKAPELFSSPPSIEPVEVLGTKN